MHRNAITIRAGFAPAALVAFSLAAAALATPAFAQVTPGIATISHGTRPLPDGNQSQSITDLDTTPLTMNFTTFDGTTGFTSAWNAEGTAGSFVIQATATAGDNPSTTTCGYNVYFTVPAGEFLTITPHQTTNDLTGVLWIQNGNSGLTYYTIDNTTPFIASQSSVFTSGEWHIYGVLYGALSATGAGGLRQFGMDVAVVPEPATLAVVGLLAPLMRRRRR